MKFNTLLLINAIVALVYGIGLVLMPDTMATLYGFTPGPETRLLAQFFGVTLLVVGLLAWFVRGVNDEGTRRAFILAHVIGEPVGVIVSLIGVLNQTMNATGWSAVVIYALLGLGYAYFLLPRPATA